MENGTPPPPFGHLRTAEPPPLSGQQTPKLYPPPSDIGYFKRSNKSRQRHSDNRTSWASVTSTSSQRQALIAAKTCRGAEAAVATRQQHSIKGQPNEGQWLKSKQTFRFEAERCYFNWIWGFCSPRVLFMRTSSYSLPGQPRSHFLFLACFAHFLFE